MSTKSVTLGALAALLAHGAAQAAPAPRVTASYPVPGASGVAPGEQTLTFTFSEPMATDRMSVTKGDAGAFPEIIGTPQFSNDGRIFSVRVRLKPATKYVLGVNGPYHKNFTSKAGTPATPFLLRFTTRPVR